MTLSIYSIRDNKTGIYHTPFFSSNDVTASRQFAMACRDKTIQLSHFPQDYDLWNLGIWDDQKGKITEQVPPVFIVGGTSFAKMQEEEIS